ncbi:glycosyltransferase [Candidatus Bathyarchaeota archaeon]|nr:glycosyltransferase [Candidatus Bathyarchaeota archaeon]
MPVHNEADMLPLSLPSIYRTEPDEVIILLDRCTDRSREIAEKITEHFNKEDSTKIITINTPHHGWKQRIAYLRRKGFRKARNDIILTTDADIVLDKKISEEISKLEDPEIALLGFKFYDYPFTLQTLLIRLISNLTAFSGYAGLYAFKKKAWLETEKMDSLRKISSSEDTHLRLSIMKKHYSAVSNTKSLHLRPSEDRERNFQRGMMYYNVVKLPLWLMILYSFSTLRFTALAGYIHARNKAIL